MQALVLAAGLGTRLRPLTLARAKPAIPVAGEPIIRRISRWLASHGVHDLVVNLHYLPHTLTAVLGDGSDLSVRVRYSWEPRHVLGSAGGPRLALPLLDEETFLIVNGDTLTDVDLGRLAEAHRASDALVTLALVANHDPQRYGGVRLDARHGVAGFARRGAPAEGSYHFIGVQVVNAEAFQSLPYGHPAQSIGGVYDALIASRPGSIRGFVSDAAFWDIGTPLDYVKTSAEYARREPRSSDPRLTASSAGRNLDMRGTAAIRDSILWDDVVLGDRCAVDHCIVTDGVRVPARSAYRDAILVPSNGEEPMVFPLGQPS